MASAIQKIATITATGTSSTMDFTGFVNTYTDLIIKVNVRSQRTGPLQDNVLLRFNSLGGTNYSYQVIYSDGSAAQGDLGSSVAYILAGYAPSASTTANTFSNGEIYISDYADTTHNKTVKTNLVGENDGVTAYMGFSAGEFLSTNAITSISLLTSSGSNWVAGSTATLYGVTKASIGGTGSKAVGGTVTTSGGYTYHTFLTSGNFRPTTNISGAEVLVIAGGGASGSGACGGGGAGGVVYASGQSFTSGTSYAAIVGAGGRCASDTNGGDGSISRFGSGTVAVGGGGGGYPANGNNGGSGGGCHRANTAGTGTAGQGNAGGIGTNSGGSNAGGGGGAGAVGQAVTFPNSILTGGDGGAGTATYSAWGAATNTGQLVNGSYYYAGGGGGSSTRGGVGGYGGGGGVNQGPSDGRQAGWPNTGGGGGADGSSRYGNGGSGIIIVRYTT